MRRHARLDICINSPDGLHEAWAKRAEIMAGEGVDARNARALAEKDPSHRSSFIPRCRTS